MMKTSWEIQKFIEEMDHYILSGLHFIHGTHHMYMGFTYRVYKIQKFFTKSEKKLSFIFSILPYQYIFSVPFYLLSTS
jgi:hypothetical protein